MSRRELRPLLPAFAHWFGITPFMIDPDPPVLTEGEVQVFVDWLNSRDDTPRDDDLPEWWDDV